MTQVTREELLDAVRVVVGAADGRVSLRRFCRKTGIPESAVYLYFDSWGDAREEAGLDRWMSSNRRYSDEQLLEEFHRVAQETRLLPTWGDVKRHATIADGTFRYRFGSLAELIERYREWLELQDEPELSEEQTHNPQQMTEDPERDVPWMRRQWFALRVGFELRSSDFRGRPAAACDVLVVLHHDWPACPVNVVPFGEVTGMRGPALDDAGATREF